MANKAFGRLKLPDSSEELIEVLEERVDMLVKERGPVDHQAKVNLAFYNGHQWLVPMVGLSSTPTLRRVRYDASDPKSRVQITVNKVAAHVDRLIARILKGMPVPECRPVSSEELDMSAARVGTRILASEASRIELQDLMTRLYYWVAPAGTAFLHPWWNAHDGAPVGYSDKGEQLYEGNVCIDVVPHFELVVAPGTTFAPLGRWACRTIPLTAEEIYERWNVEVDDGPKVSTTADEMSSLSDLFGRRDVIEKFAVRQFWLRKGCNSSREEGLVCTWVGETMLEEPEDFPFEHNHLPFAQFNYLPPTMGYLGGTPVSDIIELQQDYNHMRSREADIRDRLVPKLMAQENTVDAERYSDLVEVVFYKGMGIPPQLTDTPVNWMNMFEAAMTRVDTEMGERTGINDALRGDLAGTTPGVTVLAQQEAAAEPLAIPAKELARGLAEYGWQHLMLVRQYWEESRTIRTWSESGTLEVDRFNKADINRELDVHVIPESSLPRSKAGRVQLFMELWDKQILTDPRLLVRFLDLPPTDVLAKSFDTDVRHAERENDAMAHAKLKKVAQPMLDPMTGQPIMDGPTPLTQSAQIIDGLPEIKQWHNHEIHVAVHTDYMKTEEYDKLGDIPKAAFEGHLQAHMTILSNRMAAQMGLAPAAPGGPSASPSGPGAAPGSNGQQPGGTPSVRDIARIGGRSGEPGPVPGVEADQQAAAMGR